jgi:Predicted nucleotide-binding protein containing TIR-like domain
MPITDDLFEVADEADEALARIRDGRLQKPLMAISKACEEAKRAWSGSNIGYHATVYFEGLRPKPPDAQFSGEWGMMDVWPTHQPHPGWRIVDHQAVVDELLERAGKPNLAAIDEELAAIQRKFSSLKERAISLLTAVNRERTDPFIDRKLRQIEPLEFASAETIALSVLVRANNVTRDSRAGSQGLKVAPHQSLSAHALSATVLENGIGTLASCARETASHLKRLETRHHKASSVGTNVFIGHGRSPLWRELKDFIEDRLHLLVDEFNSVPVAGITTTARLSELLDAAAIAFLVMTAEDEQADGKIRARENVVHEVGLFQGRLSFSRAIVLLEEGCEEFSNIHGLGQIRFPKGNVSAKFEDVRAILEREGLIETSQGDREPDEA